MVMGSRMILRGALLDASCTGIATRAARNGNRAHGRSCGPLGKILGDPERELLAPKLRVRSVRYLLA